MLCPEVLNFKAPDSSFTIAKGSFSSNKLDSVSKFSYNHLVRGGVLLDDMGLFVKFSDFFRLARHIESS